MMNFLWRLGLNKLPTKDNLLHREMHHIINSPLCLFCNNHEETLEHLFFTCIFAESEIGVYIG